MPILAGIPAPDFSLPDENGVLRRLSEYRGKPVVLYFYPKDDTPGCTKQACSFRDGYVAYQRAGIVILGVSADSPQKHVRFKEKYGLPFTLLSDEDHSVCDLYGVWGPKKLMGRSYEGILRTTFLIDAKGKILCVFENIKVENHAADVLQALA